MAEADDLRDELARLRRRSRQRRDGSSLALIEIDVAGRITDWNHRAEVLFGWTAAEILGQRFGTLVPASWRALAESNLPAVLRGEQHRQRWTNLRRDGSTLVCEWHHVVLRDEHGAVEGVGCEARDVTAEEALQQRQRLMQALAEHSPLGIFAKDADGHYVYANAAFAGSLGLAAEDIVGRDDFALFEPGIAADLQRNDEAIAGGGRAMAREDAGVGPHADRTYWTLKFPVLGESGETAAICGIIQDISELRRAEHTRAQLQAQVIASQQALLAELSSPLIPLADGVVAMPLIGTIDAARVEHIVATLLEGVAAQRARAVILDVTGVRAVDSLVAAALLRAARAVRLLGAEAILTGVSADVARTLVELGVDMAGVVTISTLRGGLAYARRSK